jgi:hypothetical protein
VFKYNLGSKLVVDGTSVLIVEREGLANSYTCAASSGGSERQKVHLTPSNHTLEHTDPSGLLTMHTRVAWSSLELRLGVNYEAGGPGTVSGSEVGGQDIETEDESRVLYGVKVETSDQEGWLPRSAAVVQGYTPTYGPSTVSTVVVGESWGWRFANGWEWTSAMRYGTGFDKGDAFNQWAPSTVVKAPVGERWNVHVEYFGILSTGKEEPVDAQFASFGGHVLVTETFELGLRVGWGLNESSPNFFTNLGIGIRY